MPSASNRTMPTSNDDCGDSNANNNIDNNNYEVEKDCALMYSETATGGDSGGGDAVTQVDVQLNAVSLDSDTNAVNTVASNNAAPAGARNCQNNINHGGSGSAANNHSKERGNANDSSEMLRVALVTIDHKIRNLEKRKTKLESYREIQASGKELSSDQKAAVAKFDAVMATLDFARDLSKQLSKFVKDAEKEQKKQARKDLMTRAQAETVKIREVLVIQNIMNSMLSETVRNDFLNGENGAVQLSQADIDTLEKFAYDIRPLRPETSNDMPFVSIAQKAAEHLSMTVDARPKQYCGGGTYEYLHRIFNKIQQSNYLDKIYLMDVAEADMGGGGGGGVSAATASTVCEEPAQSDETEQCSDEYLTAEADSFAVSSNAEEPFMANAADAVVAPAAAGEKKALPATVGLLTEMNDKLQQQKQQSVRAVSPSDIQMQQQAPLVPKIPLLPVPPPPVHVPGGGSSQKHSSRTGTPVHVALYTTKNLSPAEASLGIPLVPTVTATGQLTRNAMLTNVKANSTSLSSLPHYAATTVRQLEQGIFSQHQQQQQQQQTFMQQQQHMRPLADVIGGSSFYFLQESELDSPEILFEQPNRHVSDAANSVSEIGKNAPIAVDGNQQLSSIQTQTFTNQAFPTSSQPNVAGANCRSDTSTPIFQHQQKKTLFSPSGHPTLQEQMLLSEAGVTGPMLVMTRTSARLVNMTGSSDVAEGNSVFNFTYDQQRQQQMAAVALKSNAVAEESPMVVNDWQHVATSNASNTSNSWMSVDACTVNVGMESPNGLNNNNMPTQKSKWSTIAGGSAVGDAGNMSRGIYADDKSNALNEANHWNSNQQQQNQDMSYYGKTGGGNGGGGANSGSRNLGNVNYQRRGAAGGSGGGNGSNNYRNRNHYGGTNTSQSGHGGASCAVRNNVYFRNNENASNGGGNNSYYSNGGGGGGNGTGGGGNYRGGMQRGNGASGGRNGGQPQRSASYMNSRSSNRMPNNKERL